MNNEVQASSLLELDWQQMVELITSIDRADDSWYMFVINKGTDNEFRTKFMSRQEALELAMYALEKKKLRVQT